MPQFYTHPIVYAVSATEKIQSVSKVCSETTGHGWERTFGSIRINAKRYKKGARGRGQGFERAAGGVCELFSGSLPSATAHSRQVLYDMLTQLLCHFLLILLHKSVRRQVWGPPRGHPKRIPILIISENLLSVRRKNETLAGTQPHYNQIRLRF